MSLWVVAAIAIAGGIGAAARFVVDGVITSRLSRRIPFGTLIINVSGSFALGFVVGAALDQVVSAELQAICATGFLGGYTTFSTASTQTVDLVTKGRYGAALVFGGGMFLASLAAAALGMILASAVR